MSGQPPSGEQQWQPPQYDPRAHQQRLYGQQPQYPPPPPSAYPYGPPQPPQVFIQQNNQHPREAVTVTGLDGGWLVFHWTMIICTCGLWWPVYAAHKHHANRRSVTRYR